MNSQDPRESGSTSVTLHALRHRPLVVVAVVLLGVVAGFWYALSTPAFYTSTARVIINPTVGNPYAPSPTSTRADAVTSMETEAQLVRSDAVLTAVSRSVPDAPSPGVLARRVRVSVPANTQVLEISYGATDRRLARDVTQAVADSYLAERSQRSEQVTQDQLTQIRARTATVVRDLRKATTLARQSGDPAERDFQRKLADALDSELVNLRNQENTLANSSSQPGRVFAPASLPANAVPVRLLVSTLVGALLGLLVGTALAVALERLRDLVRSARDVEEKGGVPVVAVVPAPVERGTGRTTQAATEAFDEGVRRLRSVVVDGEPPRRVVAVTSEPRVDPRGLLADALAASLAKAGSTVVVVDAGGGGLPADAAPATDPGWTDLLAGAQGTVRLLPCALPRLFRLPQGGGSHRMEDLLVLERVSGALEALRRRADVVLVMVPHALTPEAETVARAADLTLVPVAAGVSRRAEVRTVGDNAQELGVSTSAVLVTAGAASAGVERACQPPARDDRASAQEPRNGRDQATATPATAVVTESKGS